MAVPEGYTPLGTVGIAYKGEYSEETTYKYLNCVYYQGSTYLALQEVTGEAPNNDSGKWRYLAQGVVGPAAGFGEITATIDNTTGEPHVEVTASGEDTEKDIEFAFTNMKGEQGVSVTGAELREGHLYIKLSNEEEADAGEFALTKDSITAALGYTPDAQPKKKEVTLDPAQWSGEAFPYTYTIPLPDTTATQRIYATAAPGLTEAQINAFAEACITGKEQKDGQIVLQAVHKPTVELPIVIEIGGVVADA